MHVYERTQKDTYINKKVLCVNVCGVDVHIVCT